MQETMRKRLKRAQGGAGMAALLGVLALMPGCSLHPSVVAASGGPIRGVTDIAITDAVLQPAAERLGINLSEQDYFDSGMMLKNLVARDPGFEGGMYRSILRCMRPEAAQCTDEDSGSVWPQNFWQGAVYEWITGPFEGRKGNVTGSSAAVHDKVGAVLQLADAGGAAPRGSAAAAYLVVHKDLPGDATAGWWPQTEGAATLTTEFKDLSPHTVGKQALRMSAGAGAYATLAAYFDSTAGRSFLRLHGRYRLSFRAKAVSGSTMHVEMDRGSQPKVTFLAKDVPLENQWEDMHIDFDAKDAVTASPTDAAAVGTVALTFTVTQATVLLDDVSLESMDGDPLNTTAFRDEVVETLRAYHPGVLRFMENDTGLGNSVENLIAPVGARLRAGFGPWSTEQTDLGYGLPEFLGLCVAVHADPWIVVPASVSVDEMQELVQYLTKWNGKFGRIHLELGNEEWNGVYKGETIEYPEDYGHRASVIFRSARQSKGFDAKKFDLIVGGQSGWPGRNREILAHAENEDSLTVAPYLLHNVPAGASTDAIFGALFAQPELFAREGQVAQNMQVAGPLTMDIYETNLHTTEGSPTQATLDAVVPSIGAGVAMASEMLQAMRAGVRSQAMFELPGWGYKRNDGSLVKLWGTVVDMGVTNRRRPQFLAAELVNTAIQGAMTATFQGGDDPTWNETSGIDDVKLQNVHELQSFAFHDGDKRSVVLINLSRHDALPVDFTGAIQPHGHVEIGQMTALRITDSNEDAENVKLSASAVQWKTGQRLTVPAFSVMVLRWGGK